MSRSERLLIYAALALTLLLPGAPLGCDRLRAAAPVNADPPSVTLPAALAGDVGEWIIVPAKVVAGGSPHWYYPDPGLTEVNLGGLFSPDLLAKMGGRIVKAKAAGVYRVVAWNAAGDVASDPAVCVVTVGTPGPPPPPPPPNDPLTAVLQTAYDADAGPTKAAALATLAGIHADAADLAVKPEITTYGQLTKAVHTVVVGTLGDRPNGQLLGVRAAIAAEQLKFAPTDPAAPLTAAGRDAEAKFHQRVAAALKGVK